MIPHSRLLHLSCTEVLNFTYSGVVANMDQEAKMQLDRDLSAKVWRHSVDPRLPERVRSMKPPSWWRGDADPMADTFTVG